MPPFNPSFVNPDRVCEDETALHALLDDLNPTKTSAEGTKLTNFDRLIVRARRLHGLLQERGVLDGAVVQWSDEGDVGRWSVGVLEGLLKSGVGFGSGDSGGGIGLGMGNAVKGVSGLRERLERAESELERKMKEVEMLKKKVKKRDGKLWELGRYVEEIREEGDAKRRKSSKDLTALKLKLKKLEKREGVLVGEKERANKEIVLLKRKLQEVMKKGGRRPGIRMTGRVKRWEHELEAESGAEEGVSFYEMVNSGYEESKRQLMAENDDFRNLLRSAQEELDDIIVQCHSVGASSDDAELPEPAPDASRMQMPYEMIREEFETSLGAKFNLVRKCLDRIYSTRAIGVADNAIRSHMKKESLAEEGGEIETSSLLSSEKLHESIEETPQGNVSHIEEDMQGSEETFQGRPSETTVLRERFDQFVPATPQTKILEL